MNKRCSMNNEQKKEYIQPEMTVFQTVYEKNLLIVASPSDDDEDDEGTGEIEYED